MSARDAKTSPQPGLVPSKIEPVIKVNRECKQRMSDETKYISESHVEERESSRQKDKGVEL